MLDLSARKARKIESVPQLVVDDAIGRLMALFDQLRGKPPRSGGGQERGGEVAQCHRSRPCKVRH